MRRLTRLIPLSLAVVVVTAAPVAGLAAAGTDPTTPAAPTTVETDESSGGTTPTSILEGDLDAARDGVRELHGVAMDYEPVDGQFPPCVLLPVEIVNEAFDEAGLEIEIGEWVTAGDSGFSDSAIGLTCAGVAPEDEGGTPAGPGEGAQFLLAVTDFGDRRAYDDWVTDEAAGTDVDVELFPGERTGVDSLSSCETIDDESGCVGVLGIEGFSVAVYVPDAADADRPAVADLLDRLTPEVVASLSSGGIPFPS